MKKLIECVPNFSEGTRPEVVEAIVEEVRKTEGVQLKDYEYDKDYNRAVVTFFGEPQAVKQAALAVSAKALELIDMTKHKGQHPRMGAVDVVPFIPILNVTMEECIQISKEFGREFAEQFDVPVYLYDQSATQPGRKDIDDVRKGEYEVLAARMTKPEHKPDFGPAEFKPKAGATITGARKILAGLNINLGTGDLNIAKKIARAIHQRKGGLVNIKAMGTKLEERGITQIGISNVDYEQTPLYRQFEYVKMEAGRYGVPIVGSEIIGMIPLDALVDTAKYYLRLEGFKRELIIELLLLEDCLKES